MKAYATILTLLAALGAAEVTNSTEEADITKNGIPVNGTNTNNTNIDGNMVKEITKGTINAALGHVRKDTSVKEIVADAMQQAGLNQETPSDPPSNTTEPDTKPAGDEAQPAGDEAQPAAEPPAQPADAEAQPAGDEAQPAAEPAAQPADAESEPAAGGGILGGSGSALGI